MRSMGLVLRLGVLILAGCRSDKPGGKIWPGQENSSVLGTDQTRMPRGMMIAPVYPGVDITKRADSARDVSVAPSSLESR